MAPIAARRHLVRLSLGRRSGPWVAVARRRGGRDIGPVVRALL